MQDALGGQSLLSIYGVYEKLKGKSTSKLGGASSTGTGSPASPQTKTEPTDTAPKPPNEEAEVLKSQGNSAMATKDYKGAIDFYTKALNITPLNPIYLSNRAAAYSASKQHKEAATDAEMAVAADPKYTKAWSRLGLARFALGDAKGSMEAYGKGIEYEGNGGSDAMKRGYETARRRVEEEEKEGATADIDPDDVGAARSAPGGGTGGMPDLSALAGMLGGGGGRGGGVPDLGSIMSNPMLASMAQNLMSNPDLMSNFMNNPRLRQMAESFSGGGEGGGGGGMPDVSSLMQDPSIAEM